MSKGCIFVGGVHGSGKTELCKKIQEKIDCVYLSASQLLKWSKKEKIVENVQENQGILKELLKKEMQDDKLYLIDGHFALWNKEYKCEKVPLTFFEDLNIKCNLLVVENGDVIGQRLCNRNGINVSPEIIESISSLEKKHSKFIAEKLGVKFFQVNTSNKNQVNRLINQMEQVCQVQKINIRERI